MRQDNSKNKVVNVGSTYQSIEDAYLMDDYTPQPSESRMSRAARAEAAEKAEQARLRAEHIAARDAARKQEAAKKAAEEAAKAKALEEAQMRAVAKAIAERRIREEAARRNAEAKELASPKTTPAESTEAPKAEAPSVVSDNIASAAEAKADDAAAHGTADAESTGAAEAAAGSNDGGGGDGGNTSDKGGKKGKKKSRKRRRRLFPKKVGHKILLLVDLLLAGIFMVMMTLVDAFPKGIVAGILVAMIVVLFVIWRLLCSRKKKTKRRMLGTALSIIFILSYGMVSYYLLETYSMFNRITALNGEHANFHVIVPADSPYESEEDLSSKDVFTVNSIDPNYAKAQDELESEFSVKYEELHTVKGIMKRTIGSKLKPDNIVFISQDTYETLCNDYKGYEEKTKILYTVSIELDSSDIAKRTNVTEEPFNIYVSGIDVFGEINQVSRSDVNMIVTVNPKTKKILLTSIPRDSYVVLHTPQVPDKLTHSGIYGQQETISTVEDWLGLDINYYLRVNFTTLVDVVNAIDGIDVYSPVAFSSSIHDFDYQKGMNHLYGKQALYFARERHAFTEEDEARNVNQQRVMKAILKKLLSSTTLLTNYDTLLAAVQDEIQTNMTTHEIASLVKMQIDDFAKWDIETVNIHGDGRMAGTYSMGMDRMLYVSDPTPESVIEVQEAIDKVMNPTEEEIQAIEEERAARAAESKKSFWDVLMFWKKDKSDKKSK